MKKTHEIPGGFVSFMPPGLFVGLHLKPSHSKDADSVTEINEASTRLHFFLCHSLHVLTYMTGGQSHVPDLPHCLIRSLEICRDPVRVKEGAIDGC